MRNKWEKVKAKVKLVLMVDDDDDQAPSEQDIEDALKILVSRKPELLEDSEGYNRTFRELRNELVPKIDEGITLTDQNSAWKPWLSDMQSSDTWETPRSDSYYQYLVMDKNSSYSTLDYTANEIVKLLADPRRDQPAVSRKGLILGDVQSGKTRTYIALMNKAADCGYRLIIVLTSDNENLRQQTQERIDTDFNGHFIKNQQITVRKRRIRRHKRMRVFLQGPSRTNAKDAVHRRTTHVKRGYTCRSTCNDVQTRRLSPFNNPLDNIGFACTSETRKINVLAFFD